MPPFAARRISSANEPDRLLTSTRGRSNPNRIIDEWAKMSQKERTGLIALLSVTMEHIPPGVPGPGMSAKDIKRKKEKPYLAEFDPIKYRATTFVTNELTQVASFLTDPHYRGQLPEWARAFSGLRNCSELIDAMRLNDPPRSPSGSFFSRRQPEVTPPTFTPANLEALFSRTMGQHNHPEDFFPMFDLVFHEGSPSAFHTAQSSDKPYHVPFIEEYMKRLCAPLAGVHDFHVKNHDAGVYLKWRQNVLLECLGERACGRPLYPDAIPMLANALMHGLAGDPDELFFTSESEDAGVKSFTELVMLAFSKNGAHHAGVNIIQQGMLYGGFGFLPAGPNDGNPQFDSRLPVPNVAKGPNDQLLRAMLAVAFTRHHTTPEALRARENLRAGIQHMMLNRDCGENLSLDWINLVFSPKLRDSEDKVGEDESAMQQSMVRWAADILPAMDKRLKASKLIYVENLILAQMGHYAATPELAQCPPEWKGLFFEFCDTVLKSLTKKLVRNKDRQAVHDMMVALSTTQSSEPFDTFRGRAVLHFLAASLIADPADLQLVAKMLSSGQLRLSSAPELFVRRDYGFVFDVLNHCNMPALPLWKHNPELTKRADSKQLLSHYALAVLPAFYELEIDAELELSEQCFNQLLAPGVSLVLQSELFNSIYQEIRRVQHDFGDQTPLDVEQLVGLLVPLYHMQSSRPSASSNDAKAQIRTIRSIFPGISNQRSLVKKLMEIDVREPFKTLIYAASPVGFSNESREQNCVRLMVEMAACHYGSARYTQASQAGGQPAGEAELGKMLMEVMKEVLIGTRVQDAFLLLLDMLQEGWIDARYKAEIERLCRHTLGNTTLSAEFLSKMVTFSRITFHRERQIRGWINVNLHENKIDGLNADTAQQLEKVIVKCDFRSFFRNQIAEVMTPVLKRKFPEEQMAGLAVAIYPYHQWRRVMHKKADPLVVDMIADIKAHDSLFMGTPAADAYLAATAWCRSYAELMALQQSGQCPREFSTHIDTIVMALRERAAEKGSELEHEIDDEPLGLIVARAGVDPVVLHCDRLVYMNRANLSPSKLEHFAIWEKSGTQWVARSVTQSLLEKVGLPVFMDNMLRHCFRAAPIFSSSIQTVCHRIFKQSGLEISDASNKILELCITQASAHLGTKINVPLEDRKQLRRELKDDAAEKHFTYFAITAADNARRQDTVQASYLRMLDAESLALRQLPKSVLLAAQAHAYFGPQVRVIDEMQKTLIPSVTAKIRFRAVLPHEVQYMLGAIFGELSGYNALGYHSDDRNNQAVVLFRQWGAYCLAQSLEDQSCNYTDQERNAISLQLQCLVNSDACSAQTVAYLTRYPVPDLTELAARMLELV